MAPPDHAAPVLYEFYRQWQAEDVRLGHRSLDLGTYLLLLQTLSRGVGLLSYEALYTLCKALMVKPHHDEKHFERIFAKHMRQFLKTAHGGSGASGPGPNPLPTANAVAALLPPANPGASAGHALSKGTTAPGASVGSQGNSSKKTTKVALRLEAMTSQPVGQDGEPVNGSVLRFRLSGKYLPVENRSMQQHIRSIYPLNAVFKAGFSGKTDRH